MSRKFQRKIEDFECENCGQKVKGTGYTNHCPACLWSEHVDIHPGDRQNSCHGLMRPVSAYYVKGKWKIVHVCEKCEQKTEVFASGNDDLSTILELSTSSIKG